MQLSDIADKKILQRMKAKEKDLPKLRNTFLYDSILFTLSMQVLMRAIYCELQPFIVFIMKIINRIISIFKIVFFLFLMVVLASLGLFVATINFIRRKL